MRKLFHLSFIFILIFAWCNIIAQDNSASAGPIPSDVRGYSSEVVSDPTPTDNTVGYAFSTSNNQFESLPLPGGTPLSLIGAFTYVDFAGGGCFGGDGMFYVSTVGNTSGTPQIWTQDLTTGAATLVGGTGLPAAEGFNGIAYDHTTGTYYGSSGANLYTFDNSTGVATLVGPFNNIGGLSIDIAIDCAGNMYMHDLGLDNIYSIDKSTGNATLIGPTGFDANFGQGMGYDHDAGVLYLFAFNNTSFTAQLMTVDVTTGLATMVTDYGLDQHAPFDGQAGCGPPCPVGQATNPSPPSGAIDIPITGNTATWTNGAGATSIEVFFNGASVYTGTPITSLSLAGVEPFTYSTTYTWRVDGSDGTCTTFGTTWSFTTMADPSIQVTTVYPQDVPMWTGNTDGSTKTDGEINTVFPNVGWAVYDVSSILPGSVVLDLQFYGYVNATNWPYWSATPMGAVNPLTDAGSAINAQIQANRDEPLAYIYSNEASSFAPGWHDYPMVTTAIPDFEAALAQGWFAMGFVDRDDVATYFVNFDGWTQTNKPYIEVTFVPVPVELTSFTASASEGLVELSWITATETNNSGFEVQRSTGDEYEVIAFVNGHGTTTETQAYSYSDRNVNVGAYSYRLKQIDFDGTFEYSNVIEADVPAPAVFALDQNYPNPFNPSTKIAFRLAVDSKVSLKVFDILGQEVATLVNTNLVAGAHSVNFDASALNSGVYLYRIEATGNDGANFIDVKKMILTK